VLIMTSEFTARLPDPQRRPSRGPARRGQVGMAMMEVLVSILIFSFGVLGLIGLQASAINLSVDAEDRNRAALFASDIVSTMWLNDSVTVTAAQLTTWQTNIANTAGTGVPGGTVTITPVGGTTNAADILITWTPLTDQAAQQRSLTTRVVLP
jgi:type IV pilus assembly protein PilV